MNATRKYDATARQQRAQMTRMAILDAAARILEKQGFSGTTVPDIARAAGVAVPTVYAYFATKAGIVKQLLLMARFGPAYESAVKKALAATDPVMRLRCTVSVARAVYEGEQRLLELWRGAEVLSPELADLVADAEQERRGKLAATIDHLLECSALADGMQPEAALDLLWALTSRDFYRLLTVQRGWSGAQYEDRTGDVLVAALIAGKVGGSK